MLKRLMFIWLNGKSVSLLRAQNPCYLKLRACAFMTILIILLHGKLSFCRHVRGLQLLSLLTYFLNSCVLESMIPLSDLLVWWLASSVVISIQLYSIGVGFLHCADRNFTNHVLRHCQKLSLIGHNDRTEPGGMLKQLERTPKKIVPSRYSHTIGCPDETLLF